MSIQSRRGLKRKVIEKWSQIVDEWEKSTQLIMAFFYMMKYGTKK